MPGFRRRDEEAATLDSQGKEAFDARALLEIVPHRFPMLMLDRVLELEPGRRAVAIKNVSINEPYFQGHYPQMPIMPGVLIVEAMAQAAGLTTLTQGDSQEKLIPLLAGIDGVRFRRPVVPGDQLRLEAELVRFKGRIGKAHVRATVDGQLVAEAELMFAVERE